jgi:hypothetical protein
MGSSVANTGHGTEKYRQAVNNNGSFQGVVFLQSDWK